MNYTFDRGYYLSKLGEEEGCLLIDDDLAALIAFKKFNDTIWCRLG